MERMRLKVESRAKQRVKQKLVSAEPHEKGLRCPLCGCMTLNRDNAPASDGWYVEWCSGGQLFIPNFGDEPLVYHSIRTGNYTPEFIEFECPYAWAGFKK